jgi:hypothetical protein
VLPAHKASLQRPVDVVGLVFILPSEGTLLLVLFEGAVLPLKLPGLVGSAPFPQPLLPFNGGGASQPATT